MTHAIILGIRAPRTALASVALLASLSAASVVAQTPAASTGVSVLQGFVMDSIHNSPLVAARVMVEGTDRIGMTTAEGRYRIDSIPPGPHRGHCDARSARHGGPFDAHARLSIRRGPGARLGSRDSAVRKVRDGDL
jgi:hypothetical protein